MSTLFRPPPLSLQALALLAAFAVTPGRAQAQAGATTFPMPAQPPMERIRPSLFQHQSSGTVPPLDPAPQPVGPSAAPSVVAPATASTPAAATSQASATSPAPLTARSAGTTPGAASSAPRGVVAGTASAPPPLPPSLNAAASSAASTPARTRKAQAARQLRPTHAVVAQPAARSQATNDVNPSAGPADDPGDGQNGARRLFAPGRVDGTIASRDDTDRYQIDLEPGARLLVTLASSGTGADCDLYAYDDAGNLLEYSSEGAGRPDRIRLHNSSDSKTMSVFLHVLQFSGGSVELAGHYTLTVR
ncbi:MAG: hypothetical protein RIQ60_3545 [Pseudomonadota bacterium]|jgi:hypothetical protein